MASVINRGNGHWELRISCGYKDGKQLRLTKRIEATSLRAAKKELEKFCAEMADKVPNSPNSKMRFGDFVQVWEERYDSGLAMLTRTHHKVLLQRIHDVFYGVPLNKIHGEDIMAFIDTLRETKTAIKRRDEGEGQCLSATSVYQYFALLKQMFNKAVEWGVLARNPCLEIPKEQHPKPKYNHHPVWNEVDLQKFLNVVEKLPNNSRNAKYKAMLYLALIGGMRKGEICALTWDNIDWKEHTVTVDKAQKYVNSQQVEIGEPKTKSSIRRLYFDDYTMDLLRQHKKFQEEAICQNNLDVSSEYVFLATKQRDGSNVPISPNSLNIWFTKLIKKNDLPHVTVHSLRHMAATYALNNGASLTSVQAMLGHTNIKTMSIYLHPLEGQRKETARALSECMNNLRSQYVEV